MKAVICDVCGKVMNEKNFTEYDTASVGGCFVPYDVCKECRNDIRGYIKKISEERKKED